MRTAATTVGPDDALLRNAVRALQRKAGVDVVLGGHVDEAGSLRLNALRGTTTDALRGLHVVPSAGLGGRVLAMNRPVVVNDYLASRGISHDYDRPVAAESLRTMLAVPVTDGRSLRMVLYAAVRRLDPFGDRTLRCAMGVAESVSREVGVRAEVERRVQALSLDSQLRFAHVPPDSAEWDTVRTAHADLRQLARETEDPDLKKRLTTISDHLARASSPELPPPNPGDARWNLSAREVDVLSCVSAGCTNAEAAQQLHILPETVKSYLSGAMRKLGVSNRHAAATVARRSGLLP